MAGGARVENVEVLGTFRLALIKFQEIAGSAMGDAESEATRTIMWLDNDQQSFWSSQIRSRAEALSRAQEALRHKQIFKDSSGRPASCIEEQKLVAKAQERLTEAQQKLQLTKRWSKQIQKDLIQYKGQVQRFVTCLMSDIPAAIGNLGAMIHSLQEYAAAGAKGEATFDPSVAAFFSSEAEGGGGGSMRRAVPTEVRPAEEKAPAEAAPQESAPPAENKPVESNEVSS